MNITLIWLALGTIFTAAAAEDRVTLPGNLHSLARKEFDQGAAPATLPMSRMRVVVLRTIAQQNELDRFLADIQDVASPNHHRWLQPAEFGARFGPGTESVETLTAWLTSQGFQSVHASAGRTVIEFSGTAGLVEAALGTPIHKYLVNGSEYWANATEPSVPASFAGTVRGFAGLNNFARRTSGPGLHDVPGNPVTYAVAPGDFATIYNLGPNYPSVLNGSGITIAVMTDSDLLLSDIVDFRESFGLPVNTAQIVYNGPAPPISENEPTLDTSWAGAVAPQATVKAIVSSNTDVSYGIDLSEENMR